MLRNQDADSLRQKRITCFFVPIFFFFTNLASYDFFFSLNRPIKNIQLVGKAIMERDAKNKHQKNYVSCLTVVKKKKHKKISGDDEV